MSHQLVSHSDESNPHSLIKPAPGRSHSMDDPHSWREFVLDDRVVAVSNAIVLLAYKAGVTQAEVLRLVAGAMKLPYSQLIEAAGSSQDNAGPLVDTLSERVCTPHTYTPGHSSAMAHGAQSSRGGGRGSDSGASSQPTPSPKKPKPSSGALTGSNTSRAIYAHPVNADSTWDGQGDMPKWLRDAITFGRSLDEFRI